MKLYSKLSQIGFLKNSYTHKFLFVTFVGIHIPLIGLLFFVLFARDFSSSNAIILFILIMTLLATAITLFALKKLILPIEFASKALNEYRINRKIPELPTTFKDEAGLLLYNIQKSISDNESYKTEKDDLIYLLSHDLKNFTNNTQSLAKFISEEKPSVIIAEYADLIYKTTQQQFTFIETFIKLIREEHEILKKVLKFQNIDLNTILGLVKRQVDQRLITKNLKLIEVVDLKEVKIKIDQELLIRVLVNLLDNAIKFSYPNSEIKIHIGVENEKLFFVISDFGIGFNPKDSENLFKKFTNKTQLGTVGEASTGIGLYLCKKIIKMHNGIITAKSQGFNQGSTFTVFLNL